MILCVVYLLRIFKKFHRLMNNPVEWRNIISLVYVCDTLFLCTRKAGRGEGGEVEGVSNETCGSRRGKYKKACTKSLVKEVLVLLFCYVAYVGRWLRTLQWSLSPGCTETSETQQHTLRNNPADRRPHMYRGRSKKCHIFKKDIRNIYCICLFSWRYNPMWLYFHSPLAGFSLLVFEVSWSHTTTRHSR